MTEFLRSETQFATPFVGDGRLRVRGEDRHVYDGDGYLRSILSNISVAC